MIGIRVGLIVLIGSACAFAAGNDDEISEVEQRLFKAGASEEPLAKIQELIEHYEKHLAGREDSSSSSAKLSRVGLMIELSKEDSDELCTHTQRLQEYTNLAIRYMPPVGSSSLIPNPRISNAYNFIRFHKGRAFDRCANLLGKKVKKDLNLNRKEKEQMQLFKQNIDRFPNILKHWDRIVRGAWEFLKSKLPKNKQQVLEKREKCGNLFKDMILKPCNKVTESLEDSQRIYEKSKKFVKFDESTTMWLSLVEDCQLIQYRPIAMEQDFFHEAYLRSPSK